MSGLAIANRVEGNLGPPITVESDLDLTGYVVTMEIILETGEIRPTRTATIIDANNFTVDFEIGDLVRGEHRINIDLLPPDLKDFTLPDVSAIILRVRARDS